VTMGRRKSSNNKYRIANTGKKERTASYNV